MKDFRRRLELRLLIQHETRMAEPPVTFNPRQYCRRCGHPLPLTGRRGRPEAYCKGCKATRVAERKRLYRRRWARHRELGKRPEK